MSKFYLNYKNNKYKYILLTFDNNYVLQSKELVLSINKNTSYNVCFIVITEFLNENSIEILKDLMIPFIIYTIDNNIFTLKQESKWPYIIFAKLIAPFIIEEKMDYLYYMDSDFLCINNIDPMFKIQFKQSIAMCPELAGNFPTKHSKLCSSLEVYCNCGFVIYNVEKFKIYFSKDNIINSINSMMDDLIVYEQDFLNIYFKDDIKILNQVIFNNQIHEYFKKFRNVNFITQNTILVHFSFKKPWKNDCYLKSINFYLSKCTTNEMRKMVKKAKIINLLLLIPRLILKIIKKIFLKNAEVN
jgi:UDP-glucose:(galactosyl)LPS alpha-1,2-glucosyltransferase